MAVDDYQLVVLELAGVYGPLSVQTEYFQATLDPVVAATADVDLKGYYVNVSYFLTGEHRPYSRSAGTFGRVKPFENFFRVRDCDGCVQTGLGAWELAYRYSHIDLDDGISTGGQATDNTIGVNWYWNPYSRVMFNYVMSSTDRIAANDGNINVFQMRAQVDF